MNFVRYEAESGVKLGAVKGEGVVELTRHCPSLSNNTIGLITQWPHLRGDAEKIVAQSTVEGLTCTMNS